MTNSTQVRSAGDIIYSCLNLDEPRSFFLFAGAGSGKTRSLVEAVTRFRDENIERLRKEAKKVAIITYTNAACDEIKARLDFDSSFHVSTIHSFAWDLIKPYTNDIRNWLRASLDEEISDLEGKQDRARSTTTKTYIDRDRKIKSKRRRLDSLPTITKFTYNPNGDNFGRDSLNHAEVINIASNFIENRPMMQNILVRKFPFLLIDESQDTKKELMDALLKVQKKKSDCFVLGMFGDTMQRIYTDGKPDLDKNIPDSWEKPAITINYRCPKRIVTLINKIRSDADDQQQESHKGDDGVVRLFVVDVNGAVDKSRIEDCIKNTMAEMAGDSEWIASGGVKVLTLEHHMAAARSGFSTFFDSLYAIDKYKTAILDGTLAGVGLLARQVMPLIEAKTAGDEFRVTTIVREHSPLLEKGALKSSSRPLDIIGSAREAVSQLYSLWDNSSDPTLREILHTIRKTSLFPVPETLALIADRPDNDQLPDEDAGDTDPVTDAWEDALQCSFSQFKEYAKYIADESEFGTHQGIKGLQFPRVMVILDDEEARGRQFSYEKLFGTKDPSERDLQNEADGKETSIDRTRRLFYVTCSRTERSLAIVAYTKNCQQLKQFALEQNWFSNKEIIVIGEDVGND